MKKMIKQSVALGIVLSLSGAAAFAEGEVKTEAAVNDAVVATVNGKDINQSALSAYLGVVQRSNKPGNSDPRSALDDLVATELALQEAQKSDILSRPDIKKRLEELTRNILLTTWTREKVQSFDISDEEIQKAYDERVKKGASANDEYKARHILLKTEEDAKAVITEISDGADFEDVAKKKSTGPSAAKGGDLGWFKSTTMVAPFADAVKKMKKGDVSAAAVKTQFGWHVIRLEDTRPAKLPTIESMKPQLKQLVSQQRMMSYMEELRSAADVSILLPETEDGAAADKTKAE